MTRKNVRMALIILSTNSAATALGIRDGHRMTKIAAPSAERELNKLHHESSLLRTAFLLRRFPTYKSNYYNAVFYLDSTDKYRTLSSYLYQLKIDRY